MPPSGVKGICSSLLLIAYSVSLGLMLRHQSKLNFLIISFSFSITKLTSDCGELNRSSSILGMANSTCISTDSISTGFFLGRPTLFEDIL